MKIWVTENNVVHHRKPRSVATVEYVQVTKTPENVSCENLTNTDDTQGALERVIEKAKSYAVSFCTMDEYKQNEKDCLDLRYANLNQTNKPLEEFINILEQNLTNGMQIGDLLKISQIEAIKTALTRPSREAKLLEALKRIRVNIQCPNPANYSDAEKLDAVLLMVNQTIAAVEGE
jgi:hypothetical protein